VNNFTASILEMRKLEVEFYWKEKNESEKRTHALQVWNEFGTLLV